MLAKGARVSNSSGAFLGSRATLRPAHAVAALLQLSDDRYVMQLRDSNPAIFYPDHWGCFGGAVEAGEPPALALVRELEEELAVTLSPAEVAQFTEFSFDFGFAGDGIRLRTYYATVSFLARARVSPRSSPRGCLQCPAWSRTTLSPFGCTMRGGGLHPPAEGRAIRPRALRLGRRCQDRVSTRF